ncbi:8688_t:CDS:2 [Diversispora eburnea]|uniref:8688_t:CDS:1 n=1 Tax=Diversispora eburnea TaxID=1213867 RepID=A0A9N8VKI8_9GLOM|nr:8688_t:CDS:2 [Diversispora eburnea]
MATKIFIELLIIILNNVQSTQDLYSSLLVNRLWCKVTIPILWELILCQDLDKMNYKKIRKNALFIRTYISCMDNQSRTLLIQNGFDLSSSPPQATFDYPSFTHEFRVENFAYFISVYSQKIIGSDQLPGASRVFKKLETFVSETKNDDLIGPLYKSLALICDNILNMDLEFKSESQVQLLEKLISAQKRIENLSITDNGYINSNSLLWVIINQKTLKSLRLKSVNFNNFVEKSSPIEQFASLKELYIEECDGLHKSEFLIFASLFTQLSRFHLKNLFYTCPQEFIIKILVTADANLKYIGLDLYQTIPSDIFSTILNYCTKITELTLYNLSSEQVILIFDNNFNELRRFSFECVKKLDANKLLCQMAENVPESLETIRIKMGIFSADSLRKFFEGWCCKGMGGNKKMTVKRPVLSDEHLKVIEEYGIQLI